MKQVLAWLLGLIVGVVIAILVGWVLFPVDPYDTPPDTLHPDYYAEYVRLIAIAYQVDNDLGVAQTRLGYLSADAPMEILIEQTERWITQDKPERLIIPLIRLARAFGVETPMMMQYLTGDSPVDNPGGVP